MVDDPTTAGSGPPEQPIQLGQARVPLERAGETFDTPDASGRTPIVVVPLRILRLRFDLLGIAALLLVVAVLAMVLDWSGLIAGAAVIVAIVLAVLGGISAFFVRVPEGTSA